MNNCGGAERAGGQLRPSMLGGYCAPMAAPVPAVLLDSPRGTRSTPPAGTAHDRASRLDASRLLAGQIVDANSIFGFTSMLVAQPAFLERITELVDQRFSIRAKPTRPEADPADPPQPPPVSLPASCPYASSRHAYDPLRYTGVRPYPDSRGPLEFDPTPKMFGTQQIQLYATAYYYDPKSMLRSAYRMKKRRGSKPAEVEAIEKALSALQRPPKPPGPDGKKHGFHRFSDELEFEAYMMPRLFPLEFQLEWGPITSDYRNKLFQLNNAFYDMRQEGIILAVECAPSTQALLLRNVPLAPLSSSICSSGTEGDSGKPEGAGDGEGRKMEGGERRRGAGRSCDERAHRRQLCLVPHEHAEGDKHRWRTWRPYSTSGTGRGQGGGRMARGGSTSCCRGRTSTEIEPFAHERGARRGTSAGMASVPGSGNMVSLHHMPSYSTAMLGGGVSHVPGVPGRPALATHGRNPPHAPAWGGHPSAHPLRTHGNGGVGDMAAVSVVPAVPVPVEAPASINYLTYLSRLGFQNCELPVCALSSHLKLSQGLSHADMAGGGEGGGGGGRGVEGDARGGPGRATAPRMFGHGPDAYAFYAATILEDVDTGLGHMVSRTRGRGGRVLSIPEYPDLASAMDGGAQRLIYAPMPRYPLQVALPVPAVQLIPRSATPVSSCRAGERGREGRCHWRKEGGGEEGGVFKWGVWQRGCSGWSGLWRYEDA